MKIKLYILCSIFTVILLTACNEDPISLVVPKVALTGVFSQSDGRIWAVGTNGVIFYSKLISNTSNTLLAISINGQYGIITGDKGCILISNDAGITWKVTSPGTTKYLKTICFDNGLTYVGGQESAFFVSNDSGTTWQSFQLNLNLDFNRIKKESNFYLLSRTSNQSVTSKLYRLLPDNITLDSLTLPDYTNYLSDEIEIANSSLIFGTGIIYKFNLDANKNLINPRVVWDKSKLDSIQKYDVVVFEKALSFGQNIYALGYYGYNIGVIYKSTDAGENWKRIYDAKDLINIYSATAFDENNIIAVGGSGYKILTSTNAGISWQLKTLE